MKTKKILTLSVTALTMLGMVSCGGNKDTGLQDAADYLWQMYKNQSSSIKTATTDDYELVTKIIIEEKTYNVSWALTVDSNGLSNAVKLGEVENDLQIIDVTYDPVVSTKVTNYTLTATITDSKGEEVVKSFERFVPQFEFSSYEDLKDFKEGDVYNVKGVITDKSSTYDSSGKVKYLWLQNDDTGILAYNLTCSSKEKFDNELKIGNEIIVSGTVTRYNGQLEFNGGCTYQVVSTTTQTPTYTDATEVFKNATDEKDTDSLDAYQNRLVEIKGVTLGQINEANHYYYFTIGNVTTYLRTSISYTMTENDNKTLVAEWTQGYTANIKGLCVVYSGVYYIQPLDTNALEITARVLTDEVKVNNAITDIENLIPSEVVVETPITLPAKAENEEYNTVSYAWTVEEGASAVKVENGKLVITIGDQPVNCKVKVVASLNGEQAEHTYSFVVKQPETISISKFLTDKNEDDTQYIKGIVVASGANSGETGSFVIADSTGLVFSYNKFEVNVGDEIVIATKYTSYGAFPQSDTSSVVKVVSTGNDISTYLANANVTTASDLYTVLSGMADDQAIVDEYNSKALKVTGLVKSNGSGYAMYVNNEASNYVVNLYVNDTIGDELESLVGTEVTVVGYLRGVSSKYDSVTIQVSSVIE